MKWFREMARRFCDDRNREFVQDAKPGALGAVRTAVLNCQPIVFQSGVLPDSVMEATCDLDCEVLSAPFHVFSIEKASGEPLFQITADRGELSCVLLLAFEIAPGKFHTLAYCTDGTEAQRIVTTSEDCNSLLKIFIDALSHSDIGVERTHQHLNIGTSKKPKLHTIKKIIHVRPRRIGSSQATDSRQIDWSHAWLVRGHWRKTNGLGKDRAGDYCVSGMTWVNEHRKGPDDVPVVPKVRFVHAAPGVLQ